MVAEIQRTSSRLASGSNHKYPWLLQKVIKAWPTRQVEVTGSSVKVNVIFRVTVYLLSNSEHEWE